MSGCFVTYLLWVFRPLFDILVVSIACALSLILWVVRLPYLLYLGIRNGFYLKRNNGEKERLIRKKKKKVVVITGASSGMGEALALHYAAESVGSSSGGIILGLLGRDEERLRAVAERCTERGAEEVVTGTPDVCDAAALRQWIADFDSAHPIDVLICSAGVNLATAAKSTATYRDTAAEEDVWEAHAAVVGINLVGTMNAVGAVVPRMKARRRGAIAVFSSQAKLPTSGAYGVSKGGVEVLGRSLRANLARYGIGVSVVVPGWVKSQMSDALPDTPKPLCMSAEKAAEAIAAGLRLNQAVIRFPEVSSLLATFLWAIPADIYHMLWDNIGGYTMGY